MQNMYAPMAQAVRSQGRGDDSMLIHMTPGEVGGLQALAMASGGSLSINPETGLPEAGFLKNILPTILGLGLAATGVGAPLAAGIVGAGATAITGDLGKGLMAGLGAFGGASLAGGLGIGAAGEAAGNIATNVGAETAAKTAAEQTVAQGATAIPPAAPGASFTEAFAPFQQGTTTGASFTEAFAPYAQIPPLPGVAPGAVDISSVARGETLKGSGLFGKFGKDFGAAARQGLPGGIAQKAAPYLAGYGVLEPLMRPPEMEVMDSEEDEFEIPEYGQRRLRPRLDPNYPEGEISFFDPMGFERTGQSVYSSVGMAEGDEVPAPTRGLGATLAAQLPEYTRMFQTSTAP